MCNRITHKIAGITHGRHPTFVAIVPVRTSVTYGHTQKFQPLEEFQSQNTGQHVTGHQSILIVQVSAGAVKQRQPEMHSSRAYMGALLLVALAMCSPVPLNGYVIRTASSKRLDNTYHDSAFWVSKSLTQLLCIC